MTRGRILIVEDEADLAWVEQFNLESEGYDVRVALPPMPVGAIR